MIDIYELPVEELIPHPDNPRKDLGDLTELAESIRTNGIRQNLTVVAAERVDGVTIPEDDAPHYVVVIGHRRLAAAKLAGLSTVPCAVEIMDRKEQLSTMLLENMQRSDLTVYEQAMGFEQLRIVGCSVEEISDKSGFSRSTVRRRLKMAELDHRILQNVSSRQLTLEDFDRLTEIEDMAARNEVLKTIGTDNFNQVLANAKIAQAVKKKMPELEAWLKEHGAQQIERRAAWSNGYSTFYGDMGKYFGNTYIDKLGEQGNTLPTDKDIKGRDLFYVLDERTISFYVATPKAPKTSKSQEQLDRERLAREVKKQIKSLSDVHYQLRKDFIDRLTVTKSNREAVLMGAALIGLYYLHGHSVNHSDDVSAALGLDKYEYNDGKIFQGIGKLTDGGHDKELAKAVYAMYRDSAENWFADNMMVAGLVPYYSERDCNAPLKLLYNWLISLGYKMSEDEQAMMDGSHELYHRGDKK